MKSNLPNQYDTPAYSSLPTEIPLPSSKAFVFKLVLTTIVLFVMFNIFYYFYIAHYDSIHSARSWSIVDSLTEPVDVLILGDSVAQSGINPEVIEAQTGLSVYNFALSAWWVYYHDVWILERYIEKFGPPKILIWGHNYEVANRKFNAVKELTSFSYPYGITWFSDYLQLDLTDKDKRKIIERRLLPLYYRKNTTNQILLDILTGNNPLRSPYTVINGFSVRPPEDNRLVRKRARNRNWSLYGPFVVSEENRQVSDILFNIAETYDISTYIFLTPVHQKIEQNEKYFDLLRPQLEYWYEQSLRYDMVEFNPEITQYPDQHMRDGIHLNIDGANLYTQYLVDWIWGGYDPMTIDDIIDEYD